MILTDKFVYIHIPKTGGTFVTSIFNKLHCQREEGTKLSRLLARISSYCGGYFGNCQNVMKHGTCSYIPWAFRSKPIVSNTRNPYDSYVSVYEFGLWKEQTKKFNPNKEYSFTEFLKFLNGLSEDEELHLDDLSLGFLSKRFIRFFFKQPDNQICRIDESYLKN
ncbi:MAG: sulfotransferase family 2 domain-containing protein [Prochloron sp. SP5CPC1]|nr:sulfotransferase family 2 domain-containing protein [Candidatus Paraprochloron terpiosi SP5CPC1]